MQYVCKRKNYRIFQKKIIDIRLASHNICRHGTVCECETSTALHGHQLERRGFETSARGMASVNKHDLSTKTYPAKSVLRLASFSSRGSGSCDKKSNSRPTREAKSSRSALFLFFRCDAIRRNAAKIEQAAYIDSLNDVEQAIDCSF